MLQYDGLHTKAQCINKDKSLWLQKDSVTKQDDDLYEIRLSGAQSFEITRCVSKPKIMIQTIGFD